MSYLDQIGNLALDITDKMDKIKRYVHRDANQTS